MNARSIIGDDIDGGRPDYDFYPTPRGATLALLEVESFPAVIWEPACGDGAISRVLEERGHKVISEDLIYRGYGIGGKNFLYNKQKKADVIITNPPFRFAEQFIGIAYALRLNKFAYLMKLSALEGIARSRLLEQTGLSRVWVFRNRILMTRNGEEARGSGMIAFAWYVWDRTRQGPPVIGWIQEVTIQDELQLSMELSNA